LDIDHHYPSRVRRIDIHDYSLKEGDLFGRIGYCTLVNRLRIEEQLFVYPARACNGMGIGDLRLLFSLPRFTPNQASSFQAPAAILRLIAAATF
jgi:hypothetical protein